MWTVFPHPPNEFHIFGVLQRLFPFLYRKGKIWFTRLPEEEIPATFSSEPDRIFGILDAKRDRK
jgi:hypothetical protein